MRVSLCIVARDEAPFLAAAIESARAAVDEIVVVDTGSVDGTPAIARAAGARVLERPFPGDMSAAHALPVAAARGEWVLALDADEVLDPAARHRVREAAASDAFDAYTLPIRNYQHAWPFPKWRPADPLDPLAKGAVGYIPTAPVRLFRRRPEYAYSGRLHQALSIRERGGSIGHLEAPIHHYGFLRVDRDKTDRYLSLSIRSAAEQPDDPLALIDLGLHLAAVGRLGAAVDAFRRARALGDPAAVFHLGCTLREAGRPGESVPLLREAIRRNPGDASPFYDRADALEALGLAHDDLGETAAAERAYRRALRLRPESPGALVNLAALLGRRGELDAADALVERLLERHRGSSGAWSAAGLVQLRRRDPDAAATALARAVELDSSNVYALLNLGLAHVRGGRRRAAAHAYAAAREWLVQGPPRPSLEESVPRRHRGRTRRCPQSRGPDLVVGIVQRLEGGAGRVFVDWMRALAPRPRLVLCCETSPFSGLGLRAELDADGVETVAVASSSLRPVLEQVRPSLVVHHWWRQAYLDRALRVGDERWICVGHVALPMPPGYDGYAALSDYHRLFQAHLPRERVGDVPNGVDLGRFPERALRRRGPVTIAVVSRLEPTKFPRRFVDYLPPLDRARVLIAGTGGRRYELEPELAALGVGERVRFVGAVPSLRIPAFLARADVGLHVTELWEETWGMSVHEMLAAGLPVVAEPKGNLPELVVDGENGFLASSPGDVAAALERLVADRGLRERMGHASRRRAARFDSARHRDAVCRLVAEVERREPLLAGGLAPPARGRRAVHAPSLCVLVCATPRSGSSLLCEALAQTGLAGEPLEYLEQATARTNAGRWDAADIGTYLAELFERTRTPNGVCSLKLQPDDLDRLLATLRAEPGQEARSDGELVARAFPRARFVRITRTDVLRQAISWERAAQTGRWTSDGRPPPLPPVRPRFDRRAIARRLALLEEADTRWRSFFHSAGVEPVRVTYEEVVADRGAAVRRVLGELGIEVPGDLVIPPPRLHRLADSASERWVERFAGGGQAASARTRSTTASTVRSQA